MPDDGVPLLVDTTASGSHRDPEPDRLLRPSHELRPRRQPDGATRRLLRGACSGWRRADHHRGALDPPDRLALREAHPRLPPRRDPRVPTRSRMPSTATAPRSSPRSTTTAARHRRCTPGCPSGRRRRSPTRCSARSRRRSPLPRSTRSSPGTPRRRALRGGRVRRDRAPVLALVDRARLPVARHEPRTDDVRREPREPRPDHDRDRGRRRAASSAPGWRSACGSAATS